MWLSAGRLGRLAGQALPNGSCSARESGTQSGLARADPPTDIHSLTGDF